MLDVFASTAAHNSIENSAKIAWSATYLPWEQGRQPKNSTIGGASIWVLKGHKPAEYDAAAAFLAFLAQTDTQVWWHKVTGYVPLTNKAYESTKAEGWRRSRHARSPSCR